MDNFNIGDTVTLKKTHPCGGNTFKIVRLGADVKLMCNTCSHIILVDRAKLNKIIKKGNSLT